MEWKEVVEHPSLRDLPFKIEINAEGYLMMAPAKNKHRDYQARILGWLQRLAQGEGAISECNIMTSDNVKIADVAWRSAEFLKRNECDDPYRESPEVVIEVISPSSGPKAMKDKMSLYFDKGAKEVWFCDDDGNMRFFNSGGELNRSALFGQFPAKIVLDFM